MGKMCGDDVVLMMCDGFGFKLCGGVKNKVFLGCKFMGGVCVLLFIW